MNFIPICKTDQLILHYHGIPVWTTQSDQVLDDIKKTAKQFGLSTKLIDEKHADQGGMPPKEPGVVVCLNQNLVENAQLYAHLTNRHFKVLAEIKDITNISNLEIVIILLSDITLSLVYLLYEFSKDRDIVPGIIFGYNQKELERNILLKSIARHGLPSKHINRFDFFGSLPLNKKESLNGKVAGRLLAADQLKPLLNEGHDLVVIKSHSDGIDGMFGQGVLCPVDKAYLKEALEGDNDPRKLPTCIVSDHCHRLNLPLDDAIHTPNMIRPYDISAKVLFYSTCFGLPLNSKTVALQWGYARQFLNNPLIGAFITTWKPVSPNYQYVQTIADDLQNGKPIGMVIAHANRQKVDVASNSVYGIFGDPLVTLSTGEANNNQLFNIKTTSEIRPDYLNDFISKLSFWEAYFNLQLAKKTNATLHEGSTNDILYQKALTCHELVYQAKTGLYMGNKINEETLEVLHLYFIDFIYNIGPQPYKDWVKFCNNKQKVSENHQCFYCQSPIEILHFEFRSDIHSNRYLHVCPVCGISGDNPDGDHLNSMHFPGNGQIEIKGIAHLQNPSKAAIMLHFPNRKNNQCFLLEPDFSATELINLPSDVFTKGAVHCSLITLENCQLNITGIPVRAEHFSKNSL